MDLLFEIGTEEIPPSYIRPALEDLRSGIKSSLDSVGIGYSDIRTIGTPRRLVLIIHGLTEREKDVRETKLITRTVRENNVSRNLSRRLNRLLLAIENIGTSMFLTGI